MEMYGGFYGEEDFRSVAYSQIGAFKDSVSKNGGFYISRYEIGTEIERTSTNDTLTTPLVQANKYPYVYIRRDQAKSQIEAMYGEEDAESEYVVSELISSYAWDTALNFICQTNSAGYILATTRSSSYGQFGASMQNTGTDEADNYSNIYDFLGNCKEWTTEAYYRSDKSDVYRGGSFNDYSVRNYAAHRDSWSEGYASDNISARIQLYIK